MHACPRLLLVLALCCLAALPAQDKARVLPAQPRVLLIGDSISIGYTRLVQQSLDGEARVTRVRGNAGDTARGLQRIDEWLAARPGKWDVIHFNWGLWDLCYRNPESKAGGRRDKQHGKLTATIEQYTENLDKLCARLDSTGAHLIFANTTPVPPGEAGRKVGDARRYNAAARELMLARGIKINDLHAAIGDRMAALAKAPGDVHFNPEGNKVLAAPVAASIRRSLRQRNAGRLGRGMKRPAWTPTRTLVYKRTGKVELKLHVFEPAQHRQADRRPAIVFFFGGGWNRGTPQQFYPHCEYLAGRGMVAISAEYRVKKKHQTTPFECVADGKSAIRWVRAHAAELGVDPTHIAAGGGSAGGHVAAATALTPNLPESGETDPGGSRPDALVLFNPVYDNGPNGYGYKRFGARWRAISPMHNIVAGIPPAITFLGTKDQLISVATGKEFQKKMRAVSVQSELRLFEGRAHGFFNHGRGSGKDYQNSVFAMDQFLAGLGFLEGRPHPVR